MRTTFWFISISIFDLCESLANVPPFGEGAKDFLAVVALIGLVLCVAQDIKAVFK